MASAPSTPSRRSWPLLLVAAGSFVPGFGLVFAAAAVSWGLIVDRPRKRLAIGIAAAGALLNLAGVAFLMVRMQRDASFARFEAEQTRRDLDTLVVTIERYHERTSRYPDNLHVLVGMPIPTRLVNIYDHTQGLFRLPRTYEYHVAADGRSYDLFSVGPDGTPYTADDIRPGLPDTLSHSGYRPSP
ncbi:MAG: type II secretion system protein GspG [Gemmatimonadales bacterium]